MGLLTVADLVFLMEVFCFLIHLSVRVLVLSEMPASWHIHHDRIRKEGKFLQIMSLKASFILQNPVFHPVSSLGIRTVFRG